MVLRRRQQQLADRQQPVASTGLRRLRRLSHRGDRRVKPRLHRGVIGIVGESLQEIASFRLEPQGLQRVELALDILVEGVLRLGKMGARQVALPPR